MNARWAALRPVLPILAGASLMLSLAMGLRQSLGILMPPLTRDLGMSVSEFTIAISVQNLTWGVLQPFAGALAVRLGYRPLMLGGSVLYVLGLVLLTLAQGMLGVVLGAGLLIGVGLAATGSAVAMAVAAQTVSPASRSMVLGIVSAAGSTGALLAAPIGQAASMAWDWRAGAAAFVLLALAMLPAAWVAGRVDRAPARSVAGEAATSAREALGAALRQMRFVVMVLAYFVCGMQLVFLTTHLPAYLDLCGMDPMLSAQALALIGGCNILGSLFFGWAGGRYNKQALLGGIYIVRSLMFVWYFGSDPTPASTLVFAAAMGFLWLGVVPLVSGWIAQTFGLRWQAMLAGVAFCCHQLGSFFGAFGGGLAYDLLGSYSLAWQVGAGVGIVAGCAQLAFALYSRPPPPQGLAA
ncbi:MAG: MFS transporter [Comamonas sp.]